jgi:hypothetical protein
VFARCDDERLRPGSHQGGIGGAVKSVLPSVLWALGYWCAVGALLCIFFIRYRWTQEKRAAYGELSRQARELADGYEALSRMSVDDAARLLYAQAAEFWAGVQLYYEGKRIPRSLARRTNTPPQKPTSFGGRGGTTGGRWGEP